MTWLKLDDKFTRNRKIARLSDAAFRLHVSAMVYVAELELDGRLDRLDLDMLPRTAKGARLAGVAAELVNAGLWEPTEDGWEIHDWLEWNPSRAELEAKRTKRASAGAEGGRRSGEARREAKAKQALQQTGSTDEAKTNPVPARPDPGRDLTQNVRSEDLTGQSAPETPASERASENSGDGRETICPLDLEQRAAALGIAEEFAKFYQTSAEAVTEQIQEFVGYWTIGKGQGEVRRHWMLRLRQRLTELGQQKRFKAQGLVEHERRKNPKRPKPQRKPEPPPPSLDERRAMAQSALEKVTGAA